MLHRTHSKPADWRKNPEAFRPTPSATHKVCSNCPAYCCKSRFGWKVVTITTADLRDSVLIDALLAKRALTLRGDLSNPPLAEVEEMQREHWLRFDEEGCPLLVDGRCSVYANRPEACRNVLCFSEHLHQDEGPVRNRWDEWYEHLRGFGLQHQANGWPGDRSEKERDQAIDEYYQLRLYVVKRRGVLWLKIAYNIEGRRSTARVQLQKAGLSKREMYLVHPELRAYLVYRANCYRRLGTRKVVNRKAERACRKAALCAYAESIKATESHGTHLQTEPDAVH